MKKSTFVCIALATAFLSTQLAAQTATQIPPQSTTPDRVESRLGTLQFRDGMPSAETADKVYEQLDYVHAVNTFLNGIAAVNMWALRKA
jgi:hypothetical protein